jgi:hypothetical protein
MVRRGGSALHRPDGGRPKGGADAFALIGSSLRVEVFAAVMRLRETRRDAEPWLTP